MAAKLEVRKNSSLSIEIKLIVHILGVINSICIPAAGS